MVCTGGTSFIKRGIVASLKCNLEHKFCSPHCMSLCCLFSVSLMLSVILHWLLFSTHSCLLLMCTHLSPLLRQIGPSGSARTEQWIPSRSHCKKFYQVPLTKDKVNFVDSPEALQRCRNFVLKVQRTKEGFVSINQPLIKMSMRRKIGLLFKVCIVSIFIYLFYAAVLSAPFLGGWNSRS